MMILALMGTAWAGPGEIDDHSASEPALWVQESSKAAACAVKAGMCFKAGAATTVLLESAKVPRFSRAALAAANGKAHTSIAWTIEAAAQLKKAALGGNALFIFYDLADPNSVKHQENTALFQAPIKAGKAVAVRLNLSGDDGFRAGHTYRIRIAQLVNGREVVLAEGDFSLL
jgi:hypothetical protein